MILHDVGYANVPKDNPYKLDMRQMHMAEGKKIAQEILEKINYDKGKLEKVVYYVSIHDTWALGNSKIYKEDIIMGVFNDLDYMWMATEKGFVALQSILNKTPMEMYNYLETEEKPIVRPFSTMTTQKLYSTYMNERKTEVQGENSSKGELHL